MVRFVEESNLLLTNSLQSRYLELIEYGEPMYSKSLSSTGSGRVKPISEHCLMKLPYFFVAEVKILFFVDLAREGGS